ncbi:MAG TPA: hypothetical protein VF326_00080 [Anaerolineaceae bacterium]
MSQTTFPIDRDAPITGEQIEALRVAVGWDRMTGTYDQILPRSYTYFVTTQP